MATYQTPGVYYREEVRLAPSVGLLTGVPAFLGFTAKTPQDEDGAEEINIPHMLTLWPQFEEYFGSPLSGGYLARAVRGFFENGGRVCYVIPLNDALTSDKALQAGLETLASLDTIDLICAPDIMRSRQNGSAPVWAEVQTLQDAVLNHCDKLGERFAILDSLPRTSVQEVLEQRRKLSGTNGALYYPWVQVQGGPVATHGFIPPCGHVAGVYARSDQRVGVHKTPANEILEGVLDLEIDLTNAQQDELNPEGINCLRAFPGRGIRVWGGRTLSRDAAWTYINVRRLFLTAGRWIERNMSGAVFEPNDARLWARIVRELTTYFDGLFQRGALKGRTAQEAFYVKCNAETNPPEVREAGQVVTEIGLAPGVPNEFVVVRIIHSASGVTMGGPSRPA